MKMAHPNPPSSQGNLRIQISLGAQRLDLIQNSTVIISFPISSSALGIGHQEGSNQTPIGKFSICEKFGHQAPSGMVFKSRIATGQIGDEEDPADLVQTRILWLDGLEEHNANTRQRYIYIHGTNHERCIGTPCSHGCIRMRNADVIALFDAVPTGTEVVIT